MRDQCDMSRSSITSRSATQNLSAQNQSHFVSQLLALMILGEPVAVRNMEIEAGHDLKTKPTGNGSVVLSMFGSIPAFHLLRAPSNYADISF